MTNLPSVQEQHCRSWVAWRLYNLVVVSDVATDIYEVVLDSGIGQGECFNGHVDSFNVKSSKINDGE